MNYPIILISNKVDEILNGILPEVERPEKPLPPRQEKVYPPSEPKEIDGFSGFSKRLFFYLIGCGIVIVMVASEVEILMGFGIFFGIFTFSGLFWTIFGANKSDFKSKYDKTMEDYYGQIEEYKKKKILVEKEHQERLKQYDNNELTQYYRKLRDYAIYKKNYQDEDFIYKYKHNELKTLLDSNQIPIKITNSKQYSKGVTEDFFKNKLIDKFNNNLLTGCSIVFENHDTPYLPDFVIKIPELNLYLDIEIDEPYIGKTGEPIHYVDVDDFRNDFFLENNWIIVRFAEIQIIKFSDECINIISEIINRLIGLKTINLKNLGKIKTIPQWTKDEGYQLAYERFRESYLPHEFINNLKNEFSILISKFS